MKFSELNIKIDEDVFVGDKMSVDNILNREIKILEYRVKDSTQRAGTKCLHLQIELNGIKYVTFIGSSKLIKQISKAPEKAFPLETTIVKQGKSYSFT